MKKIILGTEFNDDYAYRIRSELNRLHLLKSFKPDIPVCDIDFESVETWKAYNYSDNWYIYHKSDQNKHKFQSRGISFDDELNTDGELIE